MNEDKDKRHLLLEAFEKELEQEEYPLLTQFSINQLGREALNNLKSALHNRSNKRVKEIPTTKYYQIMGILEDCAKATDFEIKKCTLEKKSWYYYEGIINIRYKLNIRSRPLPTKESADTGDFFGKMWLKFADFDGFVIANLPDSIEVKVKMRLKNESVTNYIDDNINNSK